jgi:hypothetical protein
MKEQWQKIVELERDLNLEVTLRGQVRASEKLSHACNEHGPDMARRLLRASELEPQIRLIVETVNPGLASALREVLGGDK